MTLVDYRGVTGREGVRGTAAIRAQHVSSDGAETIAATRGL